MFSFNHRREAAPTCFRSPCRASASLRHVSLSLRKSVTCWRTAAINQHEIKTARTWNILKLHCSKNLKVQTSALQNTCHTRFPSQHSEACQSYSVILFNTKKYTLKLPCAHSGKSGSRSISKPLTAMSWSSPCNDKARNQTFGEQHTTLLKRRTNTSPTL